MSDLLYPLRLIQAVRVTPFNRTLTDEFESGATSARRLWTTKEFKRRFQIQHSPLTAGEYESLRGFHRMHDGGYDTFWFRDNVTRGGNAKVRFASDFTPARARMVYDLSVELEESAPVNMLPEWNEIADVAGTAPVCWYDANRQQYSEHLGTAYLESAIHDHAAAKSYDLTMQAGTNPLSNKFSQYQYYRADGTAWAKTAANVPSSVLTGATPAFTWFAMVRAKPISQDYCYVSAGAASANGGLGIGYDTSDARYGFWNGSAVVADASCPDNSPNETWRAITVSSAQGSTDVKVYENTLQTVTLATSRSYVAGPISFFAGAGGASIANSEADSVHDLQHAMLFNVQLSTVQIGALYTLLYPQFS